MGGTSRVEIGLGIGQVVGAKLDSGQLKDLRKAVESGDGWHEVETDEGTLVINLKTVVFIRIPDQQQSIGFSQS
jgi:hypothetical protein